MDYNDTTIGPVVAVYHPAPETLDVLQPISARIEVSSSPY